MHLKLSEHSIVCMIFYKYDCQFVQMSALIIVNVYNALLLSLCMIVYINACMNVPLSECTTVCMNDCIYVRLSASTIVQEEIYLRRQSPRR